MCAVCEASPGPSKKGCHRGPWANGLCWQHALESGCQPPPAKVCKKCQEDEATYKGFSDAMGRRLRTSRKGLAVRAPWADGLCGLHAKLAGLSKKKLFDDDKAKVSNLQQRLAFSMVPKRSQSRIAEDGSNESDPENPLESSLSRRGAGSIVGVLSGRADPN